MHLPHGNKLPVGNPLLTTKMRQIKQKNGKNGKNIRWIEQKSRASSAGFSYVCLWWNALRRGQGNVANTYRSCVAFDGFRQEETH